MGKKSRSKSNKSSPCYHSCITKKDFNFGGHYKILEEWDDKNDVDEFIKTNKQADPTFGHFIIAHVTDDFLKGKDDATLRQRLVLLLHMRYFSIPQNEGKDVGPDSEITKNYKKYGRDITTKRGRINCIAREIPCDCMKAKRIEAKSMAKVAMCVGCGYEFSKEKLLRCKGCDRVQYCSKECSITHWPRHKEYCSNDNGTSSASTPAPTPN